MTRSQAVFSLSIFYFFLSVHATFAATLYLDPNTVEINRGDTLKVGVRIDTDDGECVNAVDGVLTYSENIQPVDVSRGQSIFSLWVEEPAIHKENRTITFAAGIPNGYCGRIAGDPRLTNNVVDLIFQSPGLQIGSSAGGNEAAIDFSEQTKVYQNDGLGSEASLQRFGAKITLTREPGEQLRNDWQKVILDDVLPPETFSIGLERTTNAYSNEYFITFNTTDKQSGVDHYEVIEEPLTTKNLFTWGAVTAPWIEARSPYVLQDQSLNSTLRVKAIDKAGNEYIAVLVPPESSRTMSAQTRNSIVILSVICGLLVLIFGTTLWYLWRKRRRLQPTAQHDVSLDM